MSVIVDASIVVKWYVPEVDWAKAQKVFESEEELVAPAHILGEVGEVLVRRFREGKITEGSLHSHELRFRIRCCSFPLPNCLVQRWRLPSRRDRAFMIRSISLRRNRRIHLL
ncbi:MAG: type II toxin-antitoxin system VapC family toxin [Steroidobacteraceae bacterium]